MASGIGNLKFRISNLPEGSPRVPGCGKCRSRCSFPARRPARYDPRQIAHERRAPSDPSYGDHAMTRYHAILLTAPLLVLMTACATDEEGRTKVGMSSSASLSTPGGGDRVVGADTT